MMALLISTLAIAGLWFTLLKPKASGGGSSGSPSPSALQSDVTKAHQAVTTADRAALAQGGGATGAAPASAPATATPAATASGPAGASAQTHTLANAPAHIPASKPTSKAATTTAAKSQSQAGVKIDHASHATRQRADTVVAALAHHKVVAALFYNPAATDDQAVKHELSSVSTHRGQVVKLTVPISELTRYPVITQQVPVTQSPTLVLIDRQRQATALVGFADAFSIGQRLDTVLAVK